MERKHTHSQQRVNKSFSKLSPSECETGRSQMEICVDGFKLQVSDNDKEIIGSHDFSSLCNEAFVSLDLEDQLEKYFGPKERDNCYWAIFNDWIVLKLQPCSLVPRDEVVLDINQRLSLGGVKSPDLVCLKRWNEPLADVKCSQIWVSITSPLPYRCLARASKYPENIAKVEQIIQTKFLGHVMTEGQKLLLDTSRDDQRPSKMFDMTITNIIGGSSAEGKLARGLIEKSTIIRAFPGDDTSAWITHTPAINKCRDVFNLSFLESELNCLEIGGLASQLKSVLEGVFGSESLPLPYCSSLSVAQRKVKGVLFHGRGATGKTLLASNIHQILGTPEPKIIDGSNISSKELLSLFQEAIRDDMINRFWRFLGKKGERNQLHLFIVEDVDRLYMSDQTSVLGAIKEKDATLSILMDSLDNILIIGTTKYIDLVKPNSLRAGRFELHVKFDLPNHNGRSDILKMFTSRLMKQGKCVVDVNDLDIQEIALRTEGYSPEQLMYLVHVAVFIAMKRVTPYAVYKSHLGVIDKGTKVVMDDFYPALRKVKVKGFYNHLTPYELDAPIRMIECAFDKKRAALFPGYKNLTDFY